MSKEEFNELFNLLTIEQQEELLKSLSELLNAHNPKAKVHLVA